jgi:hypothetical protein
MTDPIRDHRGKQPFHPPPPVQSGGFHGTVHDHRKRHISVSKEGAGSSTVWVIEGSGFASNSQVVIKITDKDLEQNQFSETAGDDGRFVARHSLACVSGVPLTVTAFEDANPTETFSNAVMTTCP